MDDTWCGIPANWRKTKLITRTQISEPTCVYQMILTRKSPTELRMAGKEKKKKHFMSFAQQQEQNETKWKWECRDGYAVLQELMKLC